MGDLGINKGTMIKKHQDFVFTVNVNSYLYGQANDICTPKEVILFLRSGENVVLEYIYFVYYLKG